MAVTATTLKEAFNLSKEEVRNATPPGTSTLIEHLDWNASQEVDDEIRLIPQPSADPADPLNLPMWRKLMILFAMSVHPFVANFTSSSISSVLPIYASSPVLGLPMTSFSRLTYLTAVNVLMLGASNLWWVPLANTFGRRPIILLSLIILITSSIGAAMATTFSGLMVARFFMGVGAGSADAVSPDVVGEIFFVHQRGRVMAIYTVFLSFGSLVGPVIGGYIVADMGLDWLHWMNVLLTSITFILCVIFQAETLYDRAQMTTVVIPETDKAETETREIIALDSTASSNYPPYSYLRSLRLWNYRPGIVEKFLGPYKVMRLPGVWLVAAWYAGLVGLIVTLSIVSPQLVAVPPYSWGSNAGLINLGGVVGTFFGWVYTYLVADSTAKRLAKRDLNGFNEPESRLITAFPALFLATAGALVFGIVGDNPSPNGWVGLQFGIGMVAFGLMQVPSVGFNYLIESYSSVAGDCFVAVTFIRGVVSFAWTFFVGDWVHKRGTAEPFGIFGMLTGLFALMAFPMLFWGKRLRIWTAKWVPAGAAM